MKSKSILGIITGSIIYVYALVSFILTYTVESGDWGRDADGSKLYVVFMLVGLIILTFSIIALVDFNKGRVDNTISSYCYLVVGTIAFLFFVGTAIDTLVNDFDSSDVIKVISYFAYSGLSCILGVFGYIDLRRKLNDKK